MLNVSSADFNLVVSLMSAVLGLGLPLGWLCASITPVAPAIIAAFEILAASIGQVLTAPVEMRMLESTLFALLSSSTQHSSWSRNFRWGVRTPTASLEDCTVVGLSSDDSQNSCQNSPRAETL